MIGGLGGRRSACDQSSIVATCAIKVPYLCKNAPSPSTAGVTVCWARHSSRRCTALRSADVLGASGQEADRQPSHLPTIAGAGGEGGGGRRWWWWWWGRQLSHTCQPPINLSRIFCLVNLTPRLASNEERGEGEGSGGGGGVWGGRLPWAVDRIIAA